MASSRAVNYWRSMMFTRFGSNPTQIQIRTFATSTANEFVQSQSSKAKRYLRGEFVPVYVALGLITLQLTIGFHALKQQLKYTPGVHVNKKKRETFPEVCDPDQVVDEADKLMKNSFFRKVAHVQESDRAYDLPEKLKKEVYDGNRRTETLKSVGVDPKAAAVAH